MISNGELSSMRTALEAMLPDTAYIERESWTDGTATFGSATWSTAGTVSCSLAPLTGREGELADRVSSEARWVATLPAESDVEVTDRLSISGRTFNIAAVRAPRSYEVSTRVELMEEI